MSKTENQFDRTLTRRKFLAASSALAASASVSPQERAASAAAARLEASHDAMGTLFTIVAYGPDRAALAPAANAAFDEIDRLDAQMSNYQAASELSRINRDAARQAVNVEPRLFDLIAESVRHSEESGGAFDITVGPLMKAWGFFRGEGRVPTRAELAQVMKRVGYRHIHLDREAHQIRFDAAGLELDLGGIAKGYAVDRAAEILQARGVQAALVSGGASSIYALGAPPGERAWRIHLRHPYEKKKTGDIVWLKNYSLEVSGSFEKFFKLRGKTFCHILDPRSGRPVEAMLMAAILAPRGVEIDALSTTLFVLGAEKSRAILKSRPDLNAVFYVPTPGGRHFQRTAMKSQEFGLSEASIAEFEEQA
jgi:thiamine biosynthesis lipoprotein